MFDNLTRKVRCVCTPQGGNMGMGGGMMQMGGGGMGGGGMGGNVGGAMGMNMVAGGGNAGRNLIPANDASKEWKLFVGQVPFEATESDLWPVFAQTGNILELVVLRAQGKSKGCAFVTYETKALADRAIRTLDGQVCVPACQSMCATACGSTSTCAGNCCRFDHV